MTIIPLGFSLLKTSSDLTRKQTLVVFFTLSYLILLRTEFGCFHSITPRKAPVSALRIKALDILSVPLFLIKIILLIFVEGRYPLCHHLESGLSSLSLKYVQQDLKQSSAKLAPTYNTIGINYLEQKLSFLTQFSIFLIR